jgi:hypothetical protein
LVKEEALELLDEAEHSIAEAMRISASFYTAANILIKWPDAFRAFVTGDEELFRRDMETIICAPYSLFARALLERMAMAKVEAPGAVKDLEMEMPGTIMEKKANLIRICNAMIYKLKQAKVEVQYLEERKR